MRATGILLPISSLPSAYGIGSFSKSAYEFVDQLKRADQKYWQILPLGPTGYGDSPYQPFSAFAGNPYFIDLDTLAEEGLLTQEEIIACDFGDKPEQVNYEKMYQNRFHILRTAFSRSKVGAGQKDEAFECFMNAHGEWLEDYSLFMAIKNAFGGKSWLEWPEDIRMREPQAIARWKQDCEEESRFYQFIQYKFSEQWDHVKSYANRQKVEIVGDIPIYVSMDSADSWSHPELFQFDEDHRPIRVAGCPPDAFAADGQLWGNPLYNWEYHEETQYSWWKKRIRHCMKLYDVVRVDHFRGFDAYYSIPAGDKTAANGEWVEGPGMKLLGALKAEVPDAAIIAEDLGYVTESVKKLVRDTGYPSMKVIEFAFDSREAGDYVPYGYNSNCVVYTGTHDNQTLQAWFDELTEEEQKDAAEYAAMDLADRKNLHWYFIRLALASVADTSIISMQDYLGLGSWARMNQPSTMGNNWCWRLVPGQITDDLLQKIKRLTCIYGRSTEV